MTFVELLNRRRLSAEIARVHGLSHKQADGCYRILVNHGTYCAVHHSAVGEGPCDHWRGWSV